MKQLIQLANIVNEHKICYSEVFGAGDRRSKVWEFFQGLLAGGFATDEEAARLLFDQPAGRPAYRQLKSKLKKRLLNTLFLLDLDSGDVNAMERAYMDCWKHWAAAKVLFGKGASEAAVELSKRILGKAVRFEFTELEVQITRALQMYYATRSTRASEFRHYHRLYRDASGRWSAECRAEEMYFLLLIDLLHRAATPRAIAEKAWRYYRELEPSLGKYDTYRLHRFGFLIRIIEFSCRRNYERALEVCGKALTWLEGKPFLSKSTHAGFYYQQLAFHTQLRQYEAGKRVAETALALEQPGSFNWFKNRELSLVLALHSSEYAEAARIFAAVNQQPEFADLDPLSRESWKLIEAYLYFLSLTGRIDTDASPGPTPEFRLGKFLNEVPFFSKDKRGRNIPVLVVQILISIAERRHSRTVERIEAIEKYCNRYLRKDDTYRSDCFIRMLLQIPLYGFHRAGVSRRAEPYLKKLKKMPLEVARQGRGIEIIPYELLWEMILQTLEPRFAYSVRRRKGTGGRKENGEITARNPHQPKV